MKNTIKIILILIISIICSFKIVYAENETVETNTTSKTENTSSKESSNTTAEKNETSNKEEKNEKTETNEENKQTTTETPKIENVVETKPVVEEVKKVEETPKKTTTNTNTTKTSTQTVTKSSNANLNNLGITPYDFSGFKSDKTSYNVTVPNSVKSVNVYATAKDSKSTIEGIGNVNLTEGDNKVNVVVTAEDGTQKNYTIVINRLKVGETIEKTQSSEGVGLSNIKIEGMNIEPEFSSEKYSYTVSFEGEETTLKITPETEDSSNIVQIIGNENLIDGENTILIMVSDSKENNTVIYDLKVNKNFEKIKNIKKQEEDAKNWENIKKWGLRILAFLVIFGLMAIIIIRHKKQQYEEEEELPKSLKKSNTTTQNKKKVNGKHGK